MTTGPAELFNVANKQATIAPGKSADLVLLSADPANDVLNFARVEATVRSGRVVYRRGL